MVNQKQNFKVGDWFTSFYWNGLKVGVVTDVKRRKDGVVLVSYDYLLLPTEDTVKSYVDEYKRSAKSKKFAHEKDDVFLNNTNNAGDKTITKVEADKLISDAINYQPKKKKVKPVKNETEFSKYPNLKKFLLKWMEPEELKAGHGWRKLSDEKMALVESFIKNNPKLKLKEPGDSIEYDKLVTSSAGGRAFIEWFDLVPDDEAAHYTIQDYLDALEENKYAKGGELEMAKKGTNIKTNKMENVYKISTLKELANYKKLNKNREIYSPSELDMHGIVMLRDNDKGVDYFFSIEDGGKIVFEEEEYPDKAKKGTNIKTNKMATNKKLDKEYSAIGPGERTSKKFATIHRKDGSSFRRKNANQYYPDGVPGGEDYTEKRVNRTDKNLYYEDGGSVAPFVYGIGGL